MFASVVKRMGLVKCFQAEDVENEDNELKILLKRGRLIS